MKWLNLLWLVLIPAAALAVVYLLIAPGGQETWTTDSPEALQAFERCIEADMKRYYGEASRYCAEALELDPDFVMAKLERARFLGMAGEKDAAERLFDELRGGDLSRLNPRERFLVRYRLARLDGRGKDAGEILSRYLEEHPKDPWAINIQCDGLWNERDPSLAADCYERLLEADPNWVDAQNRLGYLAMARGRFEQAEEHFNTYQYLAPDQANPHDSMGELLILIGRYEEAEDELRQALEIRSDFCASYDHLVRLFVMQGELDRAREALAERRAEPACEHHPPSARAIECVIDGWELEMEDRWEEAWELSQGPCADTSGDMHLLAHHAALETGRQAEALALEEEFRKDIKSGEDYPEERRVGEALLAHMQGIRLGLEGRAAEAAEKFEQADRLVPYWRATGMSIFKLFNQLALARALAESDQEEKARQVLEWVRSVNPRVVEYYEGPELF